MTKRRLTCLLALLAMLAALVSAPAAAQDGDVITLEPQSAPSVQGTGALVDETPGSYIVELTSLPGADGTDLATVKREKENFRAAARKAGLNIKERYSFDTLFNGISITLPGSQRARLARLEGVKAVWPNAAVSLPAVTQSAPDLYTAIDMTGAAIAQSELGFTGRGVKVAIMDTGIDYDHPDLGGSFGPGNKVFTGYDFVGDTFNADPSSPAYNPVPAPDNDPDDCQGHGTHVAGIVGANGVVKGVAPDVTFGAYRVFGCEGSTTADIMVAAMERAYADGMDVLNMSIGSSFQWPQYPTAQAASRLVNKGVVVVASIGNSGANGLYAAGAPGVGEKVIGVASFENSHIFLKQFTVSPDGMPVGYVNATAAPAAPLDGTYEMAATADVEACSALPEGSLAGKVALIRRGTCAFYNKALNAQNAGAVGVVLYNNVAGSVNPTVAGAEAITIPVVMTSKAHGDLIAARLAAGSVSLTWTDTQGSYPNSLGGRISAFSSYGVAPDLSLKPDIGAPGGNIYATYPLEKGGYATLSGTSMSSPHVAGTVALLLQARPNTPAQAVRSILQNTAVPKNWQGNPGLGYLDQVHRQGAGMVRIDKAILSTTKIEPGKLSLGESEAGPAMRTLTIENNGAEAVTYDLSHKPALSTGPNEYSVGATTGFAAVNFSLPSVTVPAGGKVSVDVAIAANSGLPQRSLYGGYIVLTPRGGGDSLRVPYAGMKGDYQSVPILTSGGSYGFPWLASRSVSTYSKQDAGATFSMVGDEIPWAVIHLDHQVAKLRLEVKDAATGVTWHRAFPDELYVGKNSTATGVYGFPFDGTTVAGKKTYTVPDGAYVLVLSVLKPLGDESNPAHWETWTSPMFTIERP